MLGERSWLLFKMRCFIINTKLRVGRKTHPSLFLLFSLVFICFNKDEWIEGSTLICELLREKSEGKYGLFCWTICKPVNAAVIKGYNGRGHPAGGLPAATRIVPQRNSFTLRRPPATPRVWFDIRRGTILMRVSLGNWLHSCRKHTHDAIVFHF